MQSDSPIIRPPPGVEPGLIGKKPYSGPESVMKNAKSENQGVKRGSDAAPEDLKMQKKSIPAKVSHDKFL
eukprot:3635430-Amphidinium_carterae.1